MMSIKPRRPRPRQDRARQILEAGCGLIRTSGRPWLGMHSLHTYGGGFHVAKYAGSSWSVVIDIWPLREDDLLPHALPMSDQKVFGCELEPDGQTYLRSFARGSWEDKFLNYATSVARRSDAVVTIHARLP